MQNKQPPNRKWDISKCPSYQLLYHIYRMKILSRNQVFLWRGMEMDRSAQVMLKKHIEDGLVGVMRYNQCQRCYVTPKGIGYLCETGKTALQGPARKTYEEYLDIVKQFPELIKSPELAQEFHIPWDVMDSIGKRLSLGERRAICRYLESKGYYGIKAEWVKTGKDPSGEEKPLWMSWKPMLLKKAELNNKRLEEAQNMEIKKLSTKFRRRLRQGGVMNLLTGAGAVVYEEDKPPFNWLMECLSHPDYEGTFPWILIEKFGLYYKRDEIIDLETGKPRCSNRMNGILFTKTGCYAVYNTMERFMRWEKNAEIVSIHVINDILKKTYPYRKKKLENLTMADGKKMVSEMPAGRVGRKGEITELDKLNFRNGRVNFSTVYTLLTLFDKVLLAELNRNGLWDIRYLIHSEAGEQENILRRLAENNPQRYSMQRTLGGDLIIKDLVNNSRVYLMEVYDLTALYKIREENIQTTIICSKEKIDPISKSIGPLLKNVVNIDTGLSEEFIRYDKNGLAENFTKQKEKSI